MLDSIIDSKITLYSFLICTAVSVVLGICIAFVNMFKSRRSKSFSVALAVLPAVVQTVIMLVNGNIGAGVAVAGAFSLVRFRSAPGSAKEIGAIFIAMAIGLATGMGYILLAIILFAVTSAVIILLTALDFGGGCNRDRILKITIPENLDYDGLFDDVFKIYLKAFSLDKVKTSAMGTLYELQYSVTLKNDCVPKQFIDELRCRNGNLNIVCAKETDNDNL